MNEINTVAKVNYEMYLENGTTGNYNLDCIVRRVESINETNKYNCLVTANLLSRIDDETLYTAAGYENVFDFASDYFGYKKSTTYAMAQVGKRFTLDDGCGNILYNYSGYEKFNFGVSQLIELKSISDDDIEFLINRDLINENTTTKHVRNVVTAKRELDKMHKNGTIEWKNDDDYAQDIYDMADEIAAVGKTRAIAMWENQETVGETVGETDGYEIDEKTAGEYFDDFLKKIAFSMGSGNISVDAIIEYREKLDELINIANN